MGNTGQHIIGLSRMRHQIFCAVQYQCIAFGEAVAIFSRFNGMSSQFARTAIYRRLIAAIMSVFALLCRPSKWPEWLPYWPDKACASGRGPYIRPRAQSPPWTDRCHHILPRQSPSSQVRRFPATRLHHSQHRHRAGWHLIYGRLVSTKSSRNIMSWACSSLSPIWGLMPGPIYADMMFSA